MVAYLFMCFLVLVSELMFNGAFSVDSREAWVEGRCLQREYEFSSSGYSEVLPTWNHSTNFSPWGSPNLCRECNLNPKSK